MPFLVGKISTNMKHALPFSQISRRVSTTAALVLASTLLVSCGDDEEKKAEPKTPEPVAEVAPTPEPVVEEKENPAELLAAAKENLFNGMLFQTVETMGKYAKQPFFIETMRNTLDLMQQYYDLLPADAENAEERTKLALSIADICRELTAYSRAGEMYAQALANYDSMPAEAQEQNEMKFKKSSILNGIASCKLMIPATKGEAVACYQEQLDWDKSVYASLVPDGTVPTITPEISTAVSNLVSSYRCMGDCLAYTEELEDARDVYKQAVELGTKLTQRTVNMMQEFIKLYTALGDLENRCGNDKDAAQAWATAAVACRQLFEKVQDNAVKLECKRYIERLTPLLQEKAALLKADAPAEEAPATEVVPAS